MKFLGRFNGEVESLEKAINVAEIWGYGNVIDVLKSAWSKKMQIKHGFPKEAADAAAGHLCAWCHVDFRTGKKQRKSK